MAVLSLYAALAGAQALAQEMPPIVRRMEVRPGGGGFAVEGFRATPPGQGRFVLTPGMPAEEVRRHVYSVAWDELQDETRLERAFLAARRQVLHGPKEAIELWLDRPEGRAAVIRYTVSPTRFSPTGLLRYLRVVMGSGQVMDQSDTHLEVLFSRENLPVRCLFEATLINARPPRWRLQYTLASVAVRRMVAVVHPPTSAPASQPAVPEAIGWQEPPAVPTPPPSSLQWKRLDDLWPPASAPPGLDWKQTPASRPSKHGPADEQLPEAAE